MCLLILYFGVSCLWLATICLALEMDRKAFVLNGAAVLSSTGSGQATTIGPFYNLLYTDTVPWGEGDKVVSWQDLRYGASSLQNSRVPIPSETATLFPPWMKGYWLAKYKLDKVSFPQGRDKLNLRVAGAGLATCLSLPNVGVNPAPFTCKFLATDSGQCYEDLAYNIPRRFESFCQGTKVSSIQTGTMLNLSPKCLVTGEGCLAKENPHLHDPASRVAIEFTGPTRRGTIFQTIDTTLLRTESAYSNDDEFSTSRNYVQFNIQQDLQTFYREILSLAPPDKRGDVNARIRVAGFLADGQSSYDDSSALVLYDYKLMLQSIDEDEASQI
jgi:hypothetical protein